MARNIACRARKYHGRYPVCAEASAIAIDAEYTITRPIASRSSVAQVSDTSYASILRGLRGNAPIAPTDLSAFQPFNVKVALLRIDGLTDALTDEGHETLASRHVVVELVETRAGGRKHDRVAMLRQREGVFDRHIQR